MAETAYTFWLMPAEPLKRLAQTIVRDLAAEFDAPEFDPHITLFVGSSSRAEAMAAAEKLAGTLSQVEIKARELAQSALYSKTFYIQFEENSAVRRMFEFLKDDITAPSDYALDPHMSLLYKAMTEEPRKALCRRSFLPMSPYRFDAVRAVEFDSPWTEKSAREYRVLNECPLKQAFNLP